MEIRLFKNWWLMTVKGILAVGFGLYIIVIFKYSIVTTFLAKIFGSIMLISGLMINTGAFLHKKTNPRWVWWLIEGVADIIIGALFLFKPQWAKAFILGIMAFWAFIIGLIQIITAIRMQGYMNNWWSLLVTGTFSILFAVLIFINPFYGKYPIVTIVGISAIIFGLIMIYMSKTLKEVYL
jgi:uncharacterized membrane protein HdeD (DUF308 family)